MPVVPGGVLSSSGWGALTTNDMTAWTGPLGISFARNPKIAVYQTRCKYIPHVVIVPVGSSLDISNSDPVLHNVRGYSNQKTVFNIAQPINGQQSTIRELVFPDPGFIELTCDTGHPWMSGIVVVASHPYYSNTGRAGNTGWIISLPESIDS